MAFNIFLEYKFDQLRYGRVGSNSQNLYMEDYHLMNMSEGKQETRKTSDSGLSMYDSNGKEDQSKNPFIIQLMNNQSYFDEESLFDDFLSDKLVQNPFQDIDRRLEDMNKIIFGPVEDILNREMSKNIFLNQYGLQGGTIPSSASAENGETLENY